MILSLAISIYIVAFSMVSYLNSSSKIYKSDLMISNLSSSWEGDELIEDISGIRESTYLYYKDLPVSIDEYEIDSFTFISDYNGDNLEAFFAGIKVDESLLDLKDDEIIFNSKLMKEYKFKVNDIVKIQFELEEEPVEHKYKILGQFDSTSFVDNGCAAIISHKTYTEILGNKPAFMFINTDDDVTQIIHSIENKVRSLDTRVVSVEEHIENMLEKNLSILNMVFILICIGLILSYVGITNNQIVSFIHRRNFILISTYSF